MRPTLAALDELPPRERLVRLVDLIQDTRYWRLERASREWARTNLRVRHMLARSERGWDCDAQRAFLYLGFTDDEAALRANGAVLRWLGAGSRGPEQWTVGIVGRSMVCSTCWPAERDRRPRVQSASDRATRTWPEGRPRIRATESDASARVDHVAAAA